MRYDLPAVKAELPIYLEDFCRFNLAMSTRDFISVYDSFIFLRISSQNLHSQDIEIIRAIVIFIPTFVITINLALIVSKFSLRL